LGLVSFQQLPANPLKSPRRLINNHSVDLNPLFKWWTNQSGARPLTAWVRITGTVVATNSWGWVIEGKAQGATGHSSTRDAAEPAAKESGKILLLHPPLQEMVEFEKLKSGLQTLNTNRQELVREGTQTKTQAQAITKEQKTLGRNNPQARALSQEAKQLNQASEQAKSQVKLLDRQIQPLKDKLATYANSEHYVVDCFALDMGREAQNMAVYDHGTVFQ
jgi:hypothetical protein